MGKKDSSGSGLFYLDQKEGNVILPSTLVGQANQMITGFQ